jgi:acyl-CoA thioesterase FadM
MARISIEFPPTFNFTATIPVRITDVNYGGHVGNDTILSIIHEARVQYLKSLGYTEKNFGGVGLIMSDVVINFKNELFYGDVISAAVAAINISRASFDIVYVLKNGDAIIAEAKTGMVCFDYDKRKVTALPEEVKQRFAK